MTQPEEFLKAILPRLLEADSALHNGDASGRIAIWSQNDPVTLFGAAKTSIGWTDISAVFEWLGSSFSNCESFDYEVIAADVSGDLAYIVGFEHTTASVNGAPPEPYSLRVTTIFRRENGEWKVVHRHGDSPPDNPSTKEQLNRMSERDG
jgi:ketosteroid isomerase-like protein